MNDKIALDIATKIIEQIFGYKNPYTLDQIRQKFAFDVQLPKSVNDTTTGAETWAQSSNPSKFITFNNYVEEAKKSDWAKPKKPLNSLDDILGAWNEINYTATERQIECENIMKCDNVYNSENLYQSQDIHHCKNVLFSDVLRRSEFVIASQRSHSCTYAMRIEDSKECTNSFGVSWSAKIANCFMIHNSYDLSDCIFCSHISSKRFCIANMQYTEEEYKKIRDIVIRWILA